MIKKNGYQPSIVESFLGLENRESFFAKIHEYIDFEEFRPLLEGCYSAIGRPGYDPLVLFKILLLERWYNLSDVQVIEQVKDRISFRSFVIGDFTCPVPDDTTLVRFRNRLKECNIYDKLLARLEISMKRHDINVKCGIVAVDATIVQASSGDKEAETGAKWTYRKGKGSVFGYKVHVAMDTESRIIEEVEVTSAAASETNHLLVPEDAEIIVADKGYDSDANRFKLIKRDITDGIMRRKPKLEEMPDEDVEHNKLISRHRAKIESKFGEMKRYNGLGRARYVGIERFKIQVILTVFAVNIKRYIKLLSM